MDKYTKSLQKYYTTPVRHLTISSSKLISAQDYQRLIKASHVKKIADNFNPLKFGEPIINYRDGFYYVVDGQHRIAALAYMNDGEPVDVKCTVFYDMTYKEEANYYSEQDDGHLRQSGYGRIYAAKEAGNADAVAFMETNKALDLSVAESDKFKGSRTILAATTLFQLFKNYGARTYHRVMRMILKTWKDDDQISVMLIKAVFCFDTRYGQRYDENSFIRKLGGANPVAIIATAKTMGGSQKDSAVTLIVNEYNKRLRPENRI